MPEKMHIGKRIKNVLVERGMTVSQFADSIPCTRENAYKIFQKNNINTGLLLSICKILKYDFFADLSKEFVSEMDTVSKLDTTVESQ